MITDNDEQDAIRRLETKVRELELCNEEKRKLN